MPLKIKNFDARRLWLAATGLSGVPTGPLDLPSIVNSLGFVQLDTIQVVARAHHHILWSRNQNYREPILDALYSDRHIFEHFSHDASIIPMEFLPMWKRQFTRKNEQIEQSKWFNGRLDAAGCLKIIERINLEGALSTHAFTSDKNAPREMWGRPAHKQTLDYLWYVGRLATCYRKNFVKYYNVPERVIPINLHEKSYPEGAQIDWLCRAALSRLGVATTKEIQQFWEAKTIAEVKAWIDSADLISVSVQGADSSWTDAVALPDIDGRLKSLP